MKEMQIVEVGRKERKGFLRNLSVTGWLILVNVVFFIAAIILLYMDENFLNYIALKPVDVMHGKYLWTFLTSMFMHAPGQGVFAFLSVHMIVNMFVLFSLGGLMEKIIGRKRFLWFYLLAGIFAGLMFVLLSYFFGNGGIGENIFGSPDIPAVGASGAIFAIAGLFVLLTPKMRFSIIFFPFFTLPAIIMIPLVLFGTWIVSYSAGFGIGNTAHLGGFLFGAVYGVYLRKKYSKKVKMISGYFAR